MNHLSIKATPLLLAIGVAHAADYPYHIIWEPVTTGTKPDGTTVPITVDSYDIEYSICNSGVPHVRTVDPTPTDVYIILPKDNYCWSVYANLGDITGSGSIPVEFHPDDDTDGDGVYDFRDNCISIENLNQVDSDADGYGNWCDADLNGDNYTNAFDTPLFRAQIGKPSIAPVYNPADFNTDGVVNSWDTVIFRGLLGYPPGPSGEK